jgi:large subunit GTPase 1
MVACGVLPIDKMTKHWEDIQVVPDRVPSHTGLPDETMAARQILKDYVDGKILLFELRPDVTDVEIAHEVTGLEGPTTFAAIGSNAGDSIEETIQHLYAATV